jgi:hypothetical protein
LNKVGAGFIDITNDSYGGKKMVKHIAWSDDKEKALEKKIIAEYSSSEVRNHLEFLSTLTRRPGSEDELKAAKYIKAKLEEYGIDGEIYEFDAYVGQMGEAKLDILSPVQNSLPALPRNFTAPTDPDGIEGELVSLGRGLEEDYEGVDVSGKIVLMEPGGLAAARMPASQRAEKKGAAAQIHIADGKSREIHMGQIRYTWGNPTPDTIDKIPQTPLISICNEDGKYLSELTKKGRVVVRLNTSAQRGYTRARLPVGMLKGTKEPEKYVLFGGHYCSYYNGATDNAAANSLMLEMARIFSKHRKSMSRGIKFAWWTCHEQGTYAGSTWYVDNFWEDVRDNAVAYLAVDGLGRGDISESVSKYIESRNSEEIRKFNEMILKDLFGLEVKSNKLNRSGDQSFWGLGLPSFFGKPNFKAEQNSEKKGAPVWYSHTPEDTIDKVDMDDLFRIPFKLNAISILRLCNNPILPYEFVTVAEVFEKRLNGLQKDAKKILDFTLLLAIVQEFKKRAEVFNRYIAEILSDFESKKTDKIYQTKLKEINSCLMEMSRLLFPVLYSKSGKYGQDPIGSRFDPIPTFEPIKKLAMLERESEEYRAWHTSLIRERNKVSDVINSANRLLDGILKKNK